jgi:hypothetical protein
LWARVGLGLGLGIGHAWLWASGGSCGACMCWCMCCMRATCEVSCVQGAVMGARFNVRGFKVPGGWGVVQCGDAWSVGSARKAGAWAGRCGLGWSAVLVVHERLGQTGCVSRLCLDGRTAEPKPQPPCATRHFHNGVVTILLPRPRPLTSEGCAGKEGSTRGVWQTTTLQYHLEPTSRPSARGEGTGAYHAAAPVSHHQVWQQIGMSPTHRRSASTSRVFELQGDST